MNNAVTAKNPPSKQAMVRKQRKRGKRLGKEWKGLWMRFLPHILTPTPPPSLSVPLTLPDDVCVSVSTILLTLNDFRYAASDYYSLGPKTNMNWDQGLI